MLYCTEIVAHGGLDGRGIGVRQPDGTVKALTVRQVADLLGHSTTQVTEMYYVKKDMKMLDGVTNDFCL